MADFLDVESLISGLGSESEITKKYAVFKLQGLLGDPSFADAFIQGDGTYALRSVVLSTMGNTQAYAFGSLNALLELDMGWDVVDSEVIEMAVELAIGHPLVNIVRNALSLLVLVVSRPLNNSSPDAEKFGFRAIKPALDNHPAFLDSLVVRLSASDHALCANALQLLNALMRDAIVHGGENEWPRFVKRLQDLGVIQGVGALMRSDAASDANGVLANAILEFQGLIKILLRNWKEVQINLDQPEHKRALKTIHLLSKPEPYHPPNQTNGDGKPVRKHHPHKWRRLGFETESPAWEFDETGYLGMMDLVDFTRRHENAYVKILMEQAVQPREERCPVARASLSVTLILYEHFEIDSTPNIDAKVNTDAERALTTNVDRMYRPLLLQWGKLHPAALNAFLRLWKAAGAEADDFYKIEEIVRIIIEHVVGSADRRTEVAKVEEQLRNVSLETARKWQMDGLEEVYDDAWGPHLVQIREQLRHESLQFMKEQRIRCLLKGQWFPTPAGVAGIDSDAAWRYVRLSHNRRWLHYQNYARQGDFDPALDELAGRVELNRVTSVDSNVTASAAPKRPSPNGVQGRNATESDETLADAQRQSEHTNTHPQPHAKITILGHPTKPKLSPTPATSNPLPEADEVILLELLPQTSNLASEWLDGLLMLLNQQPITKNTTNLVDMMEDWGVRLRMLNLRWEDVDWDELQARVKEGSAAERPVPDRAGVDDEFWYAMPEV